MKLINTISALIACALLGACIQEQHSGKELQAILDAAADSQNKNVKLSGTYYVTSPIQLTSRHSGLQIKGKNGTTISAGKKIDAWKKDGKFLKAFVDMDNVDALFVNGVRAKPAESKEMTYMFSYADKDFKHNGKTLENQDAHAFKVRNEDIKLLNSLGKDELTNAYLILYTAWFQAKLPVLDIVKNSDEKTSTLVVENNHGGAFFRWESAPRFKILNAKKVLDEAGEFYFDKHNKTLFYMPHEGETESNINATVPVLPTVLTIVSDNVKRPIESISIENVIFEHGNANTPKTVRVSGQAAANSPAFVNLQYAHDIEFSDCQFRKLNGYALSINAGSQNVKVEDCVFSDIGCGAIRVTKNKLNELNGLTRNNSSAPLEQTNFVKIKNNIIYAYGRYNRAGVGILVQDCADVEVLNNTIFDGYYTGVSIGWTWGFGKTNTKNMKVNYNKIFEIGHGCLCDMGGIYTLGACPNSEILGNEIFNVVRHRYGGWGIYNDEGSSGWTISNNYVYNTQEDGYFMHYGENCLVKNNVFENGGISQCGIGHRMFLGFKKGSRVMAGKTTLENGFVFTKNIVKYSSPSRLLRDNRPIPRKLAKFDDNIYWNDNGTVTFGKLDLEKWQKEFGQDTNSFIEDPALKDGVPTKAYKKIGFEIFDTKNAGVKGNMKDKLAKILKTHQFAEDEDYPAAAPWKKQIKKAGARKFSKNFLKK